VVDLVGPARAAECRGTMEGDTFKVVAMVAIFAASLLGAAPPVIRRRERSAGAGAPSAAHYLIRAFTSGILLSLAFLHVIADGFEKMEDLGGDFPLAPTFVLAGIMLMFVVERAGLDFLAGGEGGACCHHHAHGRALNLGGSACHRGDAVPKAFEEDLANEAPSALPDAAAHDIEADGGGASASSSGCGGGAGGCCDSGSGHGHEHTHVPLSQRLLQDATARSEEREMLAAAADREGGSQARVMLNMLEMGIIVHSVAIGLDVGASDSGETMSIGYIVALCFHQLFEGLGLGTMIVGAMQQGPGVISGTKAALMVGFFAITLPAGILLGMLLRSLPSLRDNSPQERCVSAKMSSYPKP
jgi:hypothetical protein